MAGLIKAEDVATVKERTSIVEVVRDHVTLRSAGAGSLKGLCPFHDEKSPSFTVRDVAGTFHCFGCGEGGDVVAFVQKVDHLTFVEAVERLAGRLGMELRYEEGGGRREEGLGRRGRLVEAHRAAQEFYADRLLNNPDARAARDFLRQRDFDSSAAMHFGVGFSPRGGEDLARLLLTRGFTEEELLLGGLVGRGSRGLYDRFRGRLMWPIRDTTGDTIGFGARRIFPDDRIEAKYLNTTETPIYKKSQVLYGLDLAKKSISATRVAVVVEGYTDVMAAHLSGVEGAVATCGTAFGLDHIKLLRRIMRDEPGLDPARVIFTFDGDAAGQKAAMKAFAEDQRWAAQSFVAVAADGMDPCDLRLRRGPEAVAALVEDAVPMFEFAVKTMLARHSLGSAEGRVAAMRTVAPVINTIRDSSLRPEYLRTVAGWIGVQVEQLLEETRRAGRLPAAPGPRSGATPGAEPPAESALGVMPAPNQRDPLVAAERQLLQVLLQYPELVSAAVLHQIPFDAFVAPAHRAVFEAITSVPRTPELTLASWTSRVTEAAPISVQGMVSELTVAPLPVTPDKATGRPEQRYVDSLLSRVHEVSLTREIADSMSLMRRLSADTSADPDAVRAVSVRLQELQRELATLRAGTA